MINKKMITLSVAVMMFFAFATVPVAEAFVAPMVVVPIIAAVFGTAAFVASEIIDENETKLSKSAEGETSPRDEGALTAESAVIGR